MVIALSLVVGITDALSMPSFQSIVPSIVERGQIATALALNATQFNLSRILGPALAGVVMASLGAVRMLRVERGILSAVHLGRVVDTAARETPPGTADRPPHRFRRRPQHRAHAPLRGALLTVLFTSTLCGPLIVFCPVLVKEALHGDVGDFSIAIGAFGVGGLLGASALLGSMPSATGGGSARGLPRATG